MKPTVGVNVTAFPVTIVVPLMALMTVTLLDTPVILDVRSIAAAGVLKAV